MLITPGDPHILLVHSPVHVRWEGCTSISQSKWLYWCMLASEYTVQQSQQDSSSWQISCNKFRHTKFTMTTLSCNAWTTYTSFWLVNKIRNILKYSNNIHVHIILLLWCGPPLPRFNSPIQPGIGELWNKREGCHKTEQIFTFSCSIVQHSHRSSLRESSNS